MAFQIPVSHYDNDLHAVPYEIGSDFSEKYRAYREDGFSVAIPPRKWPGHFLAIKPMRCAMGYYDIPDVPVEFRS